MRYDVEHVQPEERWRGDVHEWLEVLRELGRSEETLTTRYYQLTEFSRWVKKAPGEVTSRDVLAYMSRFSSLYTRRGVKSCLATFYAHKIKVGALSANPCDDVPTIRRPETVSRPCDDAAVEKGMSAPNEKASMMVWLMCAAGMRRAEVARASGRDVFQDISGYSLLIHGKGDRERVVPIPDDLALAILERASRDTQGWVFPGRDGGHCSVSHVERCITAATDWNPHALRHWFANRAYALSGYDLRAVQALLGHKSLATTQAYIGVNPQKLRAVVGDVEAYRKGMGGIGGNSA